MKKKTKDLKPEKPEKEQLKKKWIHLSSRVIKFYDSLAKHPHINASGCKGALQTVTNLFAAGKLETLIKYYYNGNVPDEWKKAFEIMDDIRRGKTCK